MGARGFTDTTAVTEDRLSLALAAGLTPTGLEPSPSFFHGFATHPAVVAQGLVTLADITATRYHHYVPSDQRDPVLTAHGDRLRAECFSVCNSVHVRLDLLSSGLDGGEIGLGTTNVDISAHTRRALVAIHRDELLHLDVGRDGLRVATPDRQAAERPVEMPERWVRALGNVAELHRGLRPALELDRTQARALLAGLPAATTRSPRDAWLTPTSRGVRFGPRRGPGAIRVVGPHRLSAVRRLLPQVTGLTVYVGADAGTGEAPLTLFEWDLPGARLSLGLTPTTFRGFSGEGSLLPALAGPHAAADADLVSVLLAFEPRIDGPRLARETGLADARVEAALQVLAASGRVGWDPRDLAWFHRELPHDPDRVEQDNPRLVAARELVAQQAVRPEPDGTILVDSGSSTYRVRLDAEHGARCGCAWSVRHRGGRGPCKHVLAARIHVDLLEEPDA